MWKWLFDSFRLTLVSFEARFSNTARYFLLKFYGYIELFELYKMSVVWSSKTQLSMRYWQMNFKRSVHFDQETLIFRRFFLKNGPIEIDETGWVCSACRTPQHKSGASFQNSTVLEKQNDEFYKKGWIAVIAQHWFFPIIFFQIGPILFAETSSINRARRALQNDCRLIL